MIGYSFYIELISKKKKGLPYDVMRAFLFFLSLLYGSIISIRKMLYFTFPLLRREGVSVPTLCVGNITCGGTGKTPFTLYLLEKLKDKNPAVILRGYKGKREREGGCVDACDAKQFGDEAALYFQRAPYAKIFVGKNRVKSMKKAVAEGCRVILLDDGLQHYAAKRDANIVLLHGDNPFGYDYLLPRGLLREGKEALQKASLIVVPKGVDCVSDCTAPVIETYLHIDGFFDLHGQRREIEKDAKIALFCAIGSPERFSSFMRGQGLEIVYEKFFIDHATFFKEKTEQLWKEAQAQGAKYLVCTEKDSVKIQPSHIPLVYVRTSIGIERGEEYIESLLRSIV